MEHTNEPWIEDGGIILSDHIPGETAVIARMHPDNMWANARRLVACVNYCIGIPTELMESYAMEGMAATLPMYDKQDRQIKELIQANNTNLDVLNETIGQRDELLAALEAAQLLFACRCNDATAANWLDKTQATIASVKGGAA